MKLLSPILLGLGLLSAATASDSTNHLRANTSARQLSSDSSGSDGGWMYFLFLNGLNALGDLQCGPNSCCCNESHPRCHHAPLPPLTQKHCSSSSDSGSSGGGDSGGGYAVSESAATTSYEDNENTNTEDNENTNTEEQYLEYNEYNDGSGYTNQINSGKNLNVWPFLIAALVVGIVAAALMAKKRKQTTNGGTDTLAKSVQRRMRYFGGSPALVSLAQNSYVNES